MLAGQIGIFVGDTGGVYSTNPINDGTWHNVAMTRDATTGVVQLYIDGVLNGSSTLDTGFKTAQFYLHRRVDRPQQQWQRYRGQLLQRPAR